MAGLSAVACPGGGASGGPGLLPGTPGDPSRRAGSQGAAQQETLPLPARAVHVGGLVSDQRHTRKDGEPSSRGSSGRSGEPCCQARAPRVTATPLPVCSSAAPAPREPVAQQVSSL